MSERPLIRTFSEGMLPPALVAVWWHITPRTTPISARPRVRQPGTSATFSPAASITSGSHVRE
jgi:hypothetical protein